MSRMGRVTRVTPVQTAVRNCTRDEGRPFEPLDNYEMAALEGLQ
jgi:hypothetical protein